MIRSIRTFFLGVAIFLPSSVVLLAAAVRVEDGKKVMLTYKLFVDGKLVEEADSKKPFTYTHGQRQIVPGLEKGLAGLQVRDQRTIRVLPEEAYGPVHGEAFQEIEKAKLPPDIPREKGTLLEARDPAGNPHLVKIAEVKDQTVVIDFNHPLAGKELEFQVEVLSVQ